MLASIEHVRKQSKGNDVRSEVEAWNERRRRKKEYQELKSAYDAATGSFVQRVWAAAQALDIPYIDATWMMGAWRDASGKVCPVPANFDPVRDAEPPKRAARGLKSPFKPRRAHHTN